VQRIVFAFVCKSYITAVGEIAVISRLQSPSMFKLPALSENTFLRYFNFIALYVAQGIPEGMVLFGIPAWLAMNGKTPGEIGAYVAMFSLPWSFKLVVAPMMDRFTYLPMGRRRPWVMFGQAGLIGSFIAMALIPDPLNNMWLMSAAAFAVGCFGAFQDVATDGMAIDIVPVEQQARANGFMWGSKIVGTSASLALGSLLLTQYDFSTAIMSLSVLIGLIFLVPMLLRERPREKVFPWSKGVAAAENILIQVHSWGEIFKSIWKVITLRNTIILAIVMFVSQTAFNFMATLLPVFTVQGLNWTAATYSNYFATASLIGGLGGMAIGGILIDRFGKIRMMNIYFFAVILLSIGLVVSKPLWPTNSLMVGFMVIYQILYVFSSIGLFAIAMQCCWKKISATQFTIFMTVGNLGRAAGARLIGPVKDAFAWEYTLLFFAVVMTVAWGIIQMLRIQRQLESIRVLENEQVAEDLVGNLAKQ
jgi:PAT family beta-lactamase induction signal transducer AmpG